MVTTEDVEQLNGADVLDVAGDRIGQVSDVYLDDRTGRPSWVTVKTGWFGLRESFVPLDAARVSGNQLRVPLDKSVIKDAPNFDAGAPLSPQDEDELYRHYRRADDPTGMSNQPANGSADRPTDAMEPPPTTRSTRLRRHVPGAAARANPARVSDVAGVLVCERCGSYIAEDRIDLHRAFHRETEPGVATFDRHDVPSEGVEPTDHSLPTQHHYGTRDARI